VDICLVREMLLKVRTTAKETGKWGRGYGGWTVWVTLVRVRQQRVSVLGPHRQAVLFKGDFTHV